MHAWTDEGIGYVEGFMSGGKVNPSCLGSLEVHRDKTVKDKIGGAVFSMNVLRSRRKA
jgi:hypothetical protein